MDEDALLGASDEEVSADAIGDSIAERFDSQDNDMVELELDVEEEEEWVSWK